LIGSRKTKVGDRPGVTKGAQWVRLHPQLELLDTPGILPPTALPEATMVKLAVLNLLPESVYDPEEIETAAIQLLGENYPAMLSDHYGVTSGALLALDDIARIRNCLGPGGRPDTRRAASLLLGNLRDGRIGKVMLDSPQPAH